MSFFVDLLSRLFAGLPLGLALWLGRRVGGIWYWLIPIRLGVARQNLRRAFGVQSRGRERALLRGCLDNVAMTGIEVLRLAQFSREQVLALVDIQGSEQVRAILERGRGCVAVGAHLGNVDIISQAQAYAGIPVTAAVKNIAFAPVDHLVQQTRRRSGLELLPPRGSREALHAAMKRNRLVAFVIDQHMAKHRGIVCTFFGQLASTTPAPVRFALEYDVPIVPGHSFRVGQSGQHVLRYETPLLMERPSDDPEVNVRHNTERLNRIIEGWIREHPEQWLWLHRRWKVQDNPDGWTVPPDLEGLRVAAPRGSAG